MAELLGELLERGGTDITAKDAQGRTALMLAAGRGSDSLEAVKILSRKSRHAQLKALDEEGRHAYSFAKEAGHVHISTWLESLESDFDDCTVIKCPERERCKDANRGYWSKESERDLCQRLTELEQLLENMQTQFNSNLFIA